MKRLLFVFTLSLCSLLWISIQAQSQEVFPTKNARWEVLVPAPDYKPPLKGTERGEAYLTYMVGTDSIIGTNGLKYYDLLVDSLYAGSLRTEGEKVWITFDNGGHETLLYDFGVKVGDTIRQENLQYFRETPLYEKYIYFNPIFFFWDYFFNSDSSCVELKVQNIKKGIYGKEIIIDTDFIISPEIWYEGIGSLYGMFLGKTMTTCGSINDGGCLWKQTINGIRNYPKEDYGDVQNQIGPTEISQISQDNFSLFYDPITKVLHFTKQEVTDTCVLEIYSTDGICLLRKDLSAGENKISLSFLSSGTYICKFSKDNQIITSQKIRL